MKKLVFLSTLALFLTGCVSDDIEYKGPKNSAPEEEAANSFDFSTTADVNLSVDYSACAPGTPVFFSVYSQNPLNGDTLKPGVKPIYSNFTDANGKFSQSIELPSYATDLYVYTGNFFVDEQLMNAQVSDNSVSVVASSNMVNAARRSAARRASELTNNLTSLYQLSYEVDYQTGNKIEGKQIYNDWKTWLGKWDSRTGRPEYIVKESDEGYSALTFTEEEMLGIRQSIAAAVVRKQTCPEEFRQSADLTLKQQAAVSVTLVGSNTCWNNFDTREMICHNDTPSTTIATMKMSDSRGSITRHITTLSTSRNGARTVTRSICWNACCRFCTSVVMRVTSPAVEYLSMSLNANR